MLVRSGIHIICLFVVTWDDQVGPIRVDAPIMTTTAAWETLRLTMVILQSVICACVRITLLTMPSRTTVLLIRSCMPVTYPPLAANTSCDNRGLSGSALLERFM